jgi:pyridoxamine 5'-phosphate oxidase
MLNTMMKNIADLRQEYSSAALDIADTAASPLDQFSRWFEEALRAEIKEPNAFTLSTLSAQGYPRARIVLLKGFEQAGFVFYTNYNSAKAKEMALNPQVAMTFLWHDLERQVRVEGHVEKVSSKAALRAAKSVLGPPLRARSSPTGQYWRQKWRVWHRNTQVCPFCPYRRIGEAT